jgi:drug/metabolite transporter (DMT)-like permease
MVSQRTLGYLLTFTAATCWALTGILGKISIQDANLSGFEVAFWRAIIGGAMFAIHAFIVGKWRVELRYALAFALFGIPGVAGVMGGYLVGVEKIGVSMATMLQYTSTGWIAVWGMVFFREPATIWRIGAVIMALLGAGLLCWSGGDVLLGLSAAGVAASLISGFCYSLQSAFGKKFLTKYSSVSLYMYAMPMGALVMLPFLLPQTNHLFAGLGVPELSFGVKGPMDWFNLIVLAGVTVWGAYWAYMEGVKRLEITKVGIICTVEPVMAAALAFAIFDERMAWLGFVGAAVVIGAIFISMKK